MDITTIGKKIDLINFCGSLIDLDSIDNDILI